MGLVALVEEASRALHVLKAMRSEKIDYHDYCAMD